MRSLLVAAVLLAALPCAAQQSDQWGKLLDEQKPDQAEKLCTEWTNAESVATRVEAEKCLANVALYKGQIVSLMGNDTGGGTLGEGYKPEAVDAALLHLNKGIELAPDDLSIHQGRLHVLEVAGRFKAMNAAVEDSAAKYHGKDALDRWLEYDAELGNMGQARAGLEFAETLNRLYPNSHDVIGNIGAFHSMLKEFDQALPYLKQAVELAPKDSIEVWNLGWDFDHLGNIPEADQWMSKAITLDPKGEGMANRNCLYAEFVETKLKDAERACELEKASCEKAEQTACHRHKPSTNSGPAKQP